MKTTCARARRRSIMFLLLLLLPAIAIPAASSKTPPAQWADYIAAARKVDGNADFEQRCLLYPDIPGNEWPQGAAKARCALLRRPILTLVDISALLSQPHGAAELDKRYATLLEAHYADPAQREQIFVSYEVFDESDAALAVAKRWLKASPDSAYAKFALGRQYAKQGWAARGETWAKEVPSDQMAAMQRHFVDATPLLLDALKREPRLSPACVEAAGIGRMSSDQLARAAMSWCLKVDPASYHVLLEWIYQAQPKWGGSMDQLRNVVAFAAARVKTNPMLDTLLAMQAGYEADLNHNWSESLPGLVAAAKMAPDRRYLGEAGIGYDNLGDPWSSVAYSLQSLRFRPMDAHYRYWAAVALNELGDHAWALQHAEFAATSDPKNGWNQYELGRTHMFMGGREGGRENFRLAMNDPVVRRAASLMWCQSFSARTESAQALSCTDALIKEFPEDGESWRLRTNALGAVGDIALYDAIDHFFVTMDPVKNPFHTQWASDLREFREKIPRDRFVPGKTKLFMTSD